jgi:putative phosphoserine phosphatase / 1-acylglycerol-3-phosphate O-acyltransferase
MSLDDAIAAIYAADPGPRVVACFDYDGTLISGFSAAAFYRHRIMRREIGPIELTRTILATVRGIHTEEDFASLLAMSLQTWKGRSEEELLALGAGLFKHDIGSQLHTEVWQLVQAHHEMGHTVVVASSATRFQVEPIAHEVGAHHVLCTSLEVVDGLITGRVAGRALWSEGKAAALRALAEEHGFDLPESFAYSNGTEDIPLLRTVGHPVCVEPEDGLHDLAEQEGWPVLRCKSRGGPPGVTDVVRTSAFYGGLLGGFAVGGAIGLLRRKRTTVLDVGGGIGADIGLALAGIDVNVVQGHEHLWSSRPCVFIFNHQSKLDPIIVMKLLREEFTGVAKKEARNVPIFGQVFQLAGVAFVDRGNTDQAKQALEPAVRKIREERMSLCIAPEGTRSVTPRLSRFKKGPFHIAMQAEVPIVPIVMRNVGEVMWRGAQVVRPGTIEVVVLPPIDTAAFSAETLGEHVTAVRDQFVDTLAHWPGEAVARIAPAPEPQESA